MTCLLRRAPATPQQAQEREPKSCPHVAAGRQWCVGELRRSPSDDYHLLHGNPPPLSARSIPDGEKKVELCVKTRTIMFHCPELRVRVRACVCLCVHVKKTWPVGGWALGKFPLILAGDCACSTFNSSAKIVSGGAMTLQVFRSERPQKVTEEQDGTNRRSKMARAAI